MADAHTRLSYETQRVDRDVLAAVAIGALAITLRAAMAPQLSGLDDTGYLEAAARVARGSGLEDMFPLFRTRVGMAYPLGWLLRFDLIAPAQFWVLTMLAEAVTLAALFAGTRWLTRSSRAGTITVLVYACYPFAVQQSVMFYPTAFQTMLIAVALALAAGAEQGAIRARTFGALAAGVSLGLAYLVKEDAALLVPAIVVASVITGFPRYSMVFFICVGAASIFILECATYLATTGDAAFRLSSTSGLGSGSTIPDQLQIQEIFSADAYVRSLFLMPVRVGLVWWLLIPALWSALRRRQPALQFAGAVFLIVALYLQFGSGSFSSYEPLPKTPRYTVILTPLVMTLIGAWIARLLHARRKMVALSAVAVMVAAALPCIVFLKITSSERSRNTFTAATVLESLPPAPLYTDYYSARSLAVLAPQRPEIRIWYHANFETNEIVLQADPNQQLGAYVLLDRQSAKVYTSSYQMRLPDAIAQRHPTWTTLWHGRAYASNSFERRLLEAGRTAVGRLLPDTAVARRISRSVADIIDDDDVTLFRVQ